MKKFLGISQYGGMNKNMKISLLSMLGKASRRIGRGELLIFLVVGIEF